MAWTADTVDETIRPDDAAAIRSCILDYFEGWFEWQPIDYRPVETDGAARAAALIAPLI